MPQVRPARPARPAPYGNAYGLRNRPAANGKLVVGADEGGAMQWLSDNKWYVAGGLLLAAGLAGLALHKR